MSLVYFSDNPRNIIEPCVENGEEGLDRAGRFAVQAKFIVNFGFYL